MIVIVIEIAIAIVIVLLLTEQTNIFVICKIEIFVESATVVSVEAERC